MIASLKSLQPKLPEEYLPPGLRMAQGRSVPLATSLEECRASQANQNKEPRAPQANQSSPSVKDDAPVRGSINIIHSSSLVYVVVIRDFG